MQLTNEELALMKDTQFLLTKVVVIHKVIELLETSKKKLQLSFANHQLFVPDEVLLEKGKISRGENYHNLPYVVLDFPAFFQKENIFALRTMFWWGNFFSITLHIQGIFWERYKNSILVGWDQFLSDDKYICLGPTPWEYHYRPDNYLPISKVMKDHVHVKTFFKISKKIDLQDWKHVPEETVDFYANINRILDLSP